MNRRLFHNKRNIDVEVEVDLYDELEDWDWDDFQEYFGYSNRDFNLTDNSDLLSDDDELDYDAFAWGLARGIIDKNKILTILESLK